MTARGRDEPAELALEVGHDDVAARSRRGRDAGRQRVVVERRRDRQVREHRGDGERDEQTEGADRLRPVLAPGHPCHRSATLSIFRTLGMRSGAM